MKLFLKTGGCKLNQHLASKLASGFLEGNYQITKNEDEADVFIVSVCVVTGKSEAQFRRTVNSLKSKYPDKRIILTGCVPESIKGDLEFRDQFEIIEHPDSMKRRTRQEIVIQTGCNAFCSYCIVPYYRGREYSRHVKDIIKEAEYYRANGINELVLTGVHIGRYNADGLRLTGLINALKKTGIFRIRLSSLDPDEVNDELLDEIAKDSIVAHFMHLSLQHTDDNVLRMMKRRYSYKDIEATVNKIIKKIPDCLIGADIIAGFPYENEQAFEKMYRDIEHLPINHLHVFTFSKRPGTLAYYMTDNNKPQIVKERVNRLRALADEKKGRFILNQIGTEHDIIVEGTKNGMPYGTTGNYLTVQIENPEDLRKGQIVRVLLTEYGSEGILRGIRY